MKLKIAFTLASVLATAIAAAQPEPPIVGHFTEVRRLPAAEAHQGVACDDGFLYAIGNHELGKYRKDTGERVTNWIGEEGGPLIHMNAGIVFEGKLYCAHSNYPGVPNLSSVEIWDPKDLRHIGTHSFGRADGSLTWVVPRGNRWLACFVHYSHKGGEPGRGPDWSRLVEYDGEWRETGGWAFPSALMQKLGARGYSCSGGAIGPGDYLYVTGHDDAALYVLRFPAAGPSLEWVGTIAIPTKGQAFAWDAGESGKIYLISKAGREIIVGQVTLDANQLRPGRDEMRSVGAQTEAGPAVAH